MKKVDEGVELFDEIWEKVYAAEQQNQKEKYEMDLKKEIKKLQRLRDQIKTWIGSSDVKDKDDLVDARRLIETKMEQFKVCEKETKTKTYSKEGLARAERLDPSERAKMDTENWIRDYIDQLQQLVEDADVEIERLSAGKGKKTNKTQIEEFMHRNAQHKFHIHKLEGIIRLVINDVLDVDLVDPLKDDLDYYLDSYTDDDYQQAYDEDFFYESLGLDELDVVDVDRVTQIDVKKDTAAKSDDSSASTGQDGGKNKKDKKVAPASIPLKIGRATSKTKTAEEEKAAVVTPVKKVLAPPPVRPPPPAPPSGGASMAAILKREQDQEKERQQKAILLQRQQAELQRQQQLQLQKKQQQQAELQRQEEIQRQQAQKKAQEEQLLLQQQLLEQQRRQEAATQKQKQLQMAQKAAEQAAAAQQAAPAGDSLDMLNYGLGGLSIGKSLDSNGDSSANKSNGSSFDAGYLSAINESFVHMPTLADSDRQKPYTPRNPYPCPNSYPTTPSPIFDNPAVFEKLGTDALFFIFYYAQGTYQQYLAARELKKQSWRYHKKYMTWFQRHEEPKVTTDEYEQGAYIYFDYETGWCQRIKSDFRFEYSFLEDSLQ